MAVGSPCSISQKAAIAALKGSQIPIDEMVRQLDLRRRQLMSWLNERKIPYPIPQGAFYVFADLSRCGDCLSVANRLLEQGVAVTPGIAFGPYKDYVRFSYAPLSQEQLQEGLKRMDWTKF